MPKLKKRLSPAERASQPETLPVLKLSLRLLRGETIAMGPGKAQLLEAIERCGSISAAGRSMEMSYRRAWVLVDEMNRSFRTPLVETAKGGSHGGGAKLTPFGEQVLANYRQMSEATRKVAQAYIGLFEGLMATGPMDSPDLPPGGDYSSVSGSNEAAPRT